MISRKRFNKERLLSGTLTETLLLFIFILLAIASIYEKKNRELNIALQESNILGPDQVPIDSTELIQLLTIATKVDDVIDELEKTKQDIGDKDKQIDRYKGLVDTKGVMPPACVIADTNKQVLFEVDYGPNDIFLLKVVNLEVPLKIDDLILTNGDRHVLTQKKFNQLGLMLHESQRINPNDSNCDRNVKGAYSSANCYHCVYVVDIANHSKDPYFYKAISSFNVGKEKVKKMQRNLQSYFMIK